MDRMVTLLGSNEDAQGYGYVKKLPDELVSEMHSMSIGRGDGSKYSFNMYAETAIDYYIQKNELPPSNIRSLVLWTMITRSDCSDSDKDYAIREMLMLR
jgi:hypothetical protein